MFGKLLVDHHLPALVFGFDSVTAFLVLILSRHRTMGSLPGVRVSEATSPITLAPLLADRHCGKGTELILYMNPGELLSRPFTSKDTHSTAGDLLVVYAAVGRCDRTHLHTSRSVPHGQSLGAS